MRSLFLVLVISLNISFAYTQENKIIPADARTEQYIPFLKSKNVALVVNQSAVIGQTHLLDTLLSLKIKVVKIFAPEHGFRGHAERGAHLHNSTDSLTGVPIISLFGKHRKPQKADFDNVDIVVFDIQDAGARFFTYISTMYYVMQACAEQQKLFLVLDRPNPLGDYVDGPVLDTAYRSFVGMFPIPVVHGLTVGELAEMINGQHWLKNNLQCSIVVIPVANYTHAKPWHIAIKPSPNLPNDLAIRLYPSLCFFEATKISVGRGTQTPFQVIGYPNSTFGKYRFVPHDIKGMQMNPLHEGKTCYGLDLRQSDPRQTFSLKYLIEFRDKCQRKEAFISNIHWFNLLAGNKELAQQITQGWTEDQIRATWKKNLKKYKKIRKKYLLYPLQ